MADDQPKKRSRQERNTARRVNDKARIKREAKAREKRRKENGGT